MAIFSGADPKDIKRIRHETDPDKVDFNDVLKMGPKKGEQLVRNIVGHELSLEDKIAKTYATTRIRQLKKCRIDDMLDYLQYKQERI